MAADQDISKINTAEPPPIPTGVVIPPESEISVKTPEDGNNIDKKTTAKNKGKKRKAKVLRDETAPRQPLTGYVRYLNERREVLRAANPRLGFAEVTRRLASEWGRLPALEKQPFLDAAEQDRERYIKEWSVYKESDAYRAFKQQQQDRKDAAEGKAGTITSPPTKRQKGGGAQSKIVIPVQKIENHNENANSQPDPAPVPTTNGTASLQQPMTPLTVNSILSPNRPKSAIAPIMPPSGLLNSQDMNRSGADCNQRETDIPIFTEQFLQHNKLRETELRQLRKANTDYEQQNAILQKHIENMRSAVEKTKADSVAQKARTTMLRGHLTSLVERLARGLTGVPLPGGFSGASKQNIEQYMESLRVLAAESKNHAAVKQAREFLNRMEMPA